MVTNAKYLWKNWVECDIMNLAKNFYRRPKNTDQYARVTVLQLTKKDIEELFPVDCYKELTGIKISMGLLDNTQDSNVVRFAPIIACAYSDKTISRQFVVSEEEHLIAMDASYIPDALKSDLLQNWRELESHLIDDIFIAEKEFKNTSDDTAKSQRQVKRMVRLLSYNFSNNPNSQNYILLQAMLDILKKKKVPTNFYFHLGVDYNKFSKRDKFSFSPIIELQFDKGEFTNEDLGRFHKMGMRYSKFNNTESLNIEYISPCPSTCD